MEAGRQAGEVSRYACLQVNMYVGLYVCMHVRMVSMYAF